jgi:GLPGLI family protein
MKKIFIAILLFISALSLQAQTKYITQGKIYYERRINQLRVMEEEEENSWTAEMKKVYPRFVNDNFVLSFNKDKSVYRLEKENPANKYLWGTKPSEDEVTVQNVSDKKLSVQREVFEQTYLIQDSLRKLPWTITGETRTIAGFECRKAVTRICDSVYVVAFYTDDIVVSSGPESFGGLPGMILGLAVPRMYATWFATRVELPEPATAELNPKQKGKKVGWKQLSDELGKALKDWGKYGAKNIWKASL